MLYALGSHIDLSVPSAECGYYECVADLIDTEVVRSMEQFHHHGHTSCFQHCVNVSYYNYVFARFLGLDERAAARGGLLHDLFLYDWHEYVKEPGQQMHGWTHPATALKNAREHFELTPVEENMILRHMFPLTPIPPKCREAWLITFTDKFCGAWEVIDHQFLKIRTAFGRIKALFGGAGA